MSPSTPSYSPDQLDLYLHRIQYPDATNTIPRLQALQLAIKQDPLATLTTLQQKHLAAIPWGNSALHYSLHRSISTHPAHLFDKMVLHRRDGYCMEQNTLLYGVLRSVGYDVYPCGGRVSNMVGAHGDVDPSQARYTTMSHMVLIVLIHGVKYMVDVGFGVNGPTSPLVLEDGIGQSHMAPAYMGLSHECLPEMVNQTDDQRVWVYKVNYNLEGIKWVAGFDLDRGWIPQYAFMDVELLPQDFEMMNFYTSQNRSSWFTQQLVCTRVILDEKHQEPVGIYILSGKQVKKRVNGKTEMVEMIETEDDRVRALAKWFDMHFLPHEVDGIRGLVSQIK